MSPSNVKTIEFNLRRGIAYICSSSRTVMKLWISTPPFIKTDWLSLSIDEKFAILLRAFEGSRDKVPMPKNSEDYSNSILKSFGFSSWKKFYQDGKHCRLILIWKKNSTNLHL